MTLGQMIRAYRSDNKKTLKEFSEKAGISIAYVSLLELGRQTHGKKVVPSLSVYAGCASAMGMTLDELLEQLDDEEIVALIPNKLDRIRHDRLTELQLICDQLPQSAQDDVLEYAKWMFDKYGKEKGNENKS